MRLTLSAESAHWLGITGSGAWLIPFEGGGRSCRRIKASIAAAAAPRGLTGFQLGPGSVDASFTLSKVLPQRLIQLGDQTVPFQAAVWVKLAKTSGRLSEFVVVARAQGT